MAILSIQQLVRSYRTPQGEVQRVIDVPELIIRDGEQIALAGESGSGKTTLLNLIAGILTPDQGRIVFGGQDIAAMNESDRDRWRARHIGYVFQTFNLLQGYTALENVQMGMMFGTGIDEAKAIALLERVGLADRMGYRPRQLSVGQQQRVAIARALASQPRLVLADEPTGNLDPRHAMEAMKLIREVCAEQGAALLVVTHDQRMLDLFDDVRQLADINHASTANDVTREEAAAKETAPGEDSPAATGDNATEHQTSASATTEPERSP